MKYALIACLLALASQPVLADTYKWINDDGVVTYSQTPPPGRKSERIKSSGSRSDTTQESKSRVDDLRQRLADSAEDREMQKQEQQKVEEKNKIMKQNCAAARSNLSKLESLGNRLYKTGGEYRRLSEEERQELMEKERGHIKENCGK